MQEITVDKADLIAKIQANRDEHRSLFLKALEVYREKMEKEFEQRLQEIREGSQIRRSFSLPVPEDHTQEFDTAIEMLQWETGDTVMLSHNDFRCFVQNRWQWEASFAANTASYLAE